MTAPRITDEAVMAAAKAVSLDWQNFVPGMRAALEAAVPLLARQPVVDREAAAKALHESDAQRHVWASRFCSGACQRRYHQSADAVLALLNGGVS